MAYEFNNSEKEVYRAVLRVAGTVLLLALIGLLLTGEVRGATVITQPGVWRWTVESAPGPAFNLVSGTITWDNERYTITTDRVEGEGYRLGKIGFSGAVVDPEYRHRLKLIFNWYGQQVSVGRLERLVSFVPPGLGYIPYMHMYGGYWPDDIPRWLGDCNEPWYQQQQAWLRSIQKHADYCDRGLPIKPTDCDGDHSTADPVPEPGTATAVVTALCVLGIVLFLKSLWSYATDKDDENYYDDDWY